jgi:cytidylate kinase
MIVLISRELGAGGGSVGEALADALDATLLDERAIISALAERVPVAASDRERGLERPPTIGQRLLSNLARSSAMLGGTEMLEFVQLPEESIPTIVREIILEYARDGNVVVVGYGGRSALGWRPIECATLSVLLWAGTQWRVAQLARRYGIGADEALRRVKQTDEDRARYQQHYFHVDLYDTSLYDLVLNTEALGLELAIELCEVAAYRIAAAETARGGTAPEVS